MSEPTLAPVRQSEDRVDTSRVVAIGVTALVVFSIACFIVWLSYRALGGAWVQNPAHVPPEIGREEIGLVIQVPFWRTEAVPPQQAQRERLHSYGWVDREKGTIHIPIERAMELMLEGQAER